jgi:uncharacterized protein YjiK
MNRNLTLLLVLFFFSCGDSAEKKTEKRDTANSVAEIKLTQVIPEELKEISGISFVNDSQVVAVQDETGVLFFYDLQKKTITRQLRFGSTGDYEDVAVAGNTVYIVNSAGTVFEIANFRTKPAPAREYKTPLTEKNNIEGLAWDKKYNRLLLAAKDKGLVNESEKEIYAFDLRTKRLNPKPVYTIRLKEIEDFFRGDELEEASKEFLKALGNSKLNKVFRTSAIARHPTTGDLYVLTSLNNMIAVLSPSGKVKRIIELTGPDYNQPEGLAFTSDARLFVSNESNGRRANIIQITYD